MQSPATYPLPAAVQEAYTAWARADDKELRVLTRTRPRHMQSQEFLDAATVARDAYRELRARCWEAGIDPESLDNPL